MADRREWCGALLACARGNEVECNLPKGHKGKHEHIMANRATCPTCGSDARNNRGVKRCKMACPPENWRWVKDEQLTCTDYIECADPWHESSPGAAALPRAQREEGATPQLQEIFNRHFPNGAVGVWEFGLEAYNSGARAGVAATVQELDGVCEFCGDPTNSYHGNPGLWPLRFCRPDGTGVTKVHHTKCVTERLFGAGVAATVETPLDWEEADTRKATPQKWDKVASELIDGLKLRGIQYNEDLCCEGTPWESVAEPEPRYFATFLEAYDFQIKLAGVAATVETPPVGDCDCPCDVCAIGTGKHCGKPPCEAGETKIDQQSPSGWEEITGLSLEEQMMLDELAHGLVKPKSLKWICDMIKERQAK